MYSASYSHSVIKDVKQISNLKKNKGQKHQTVASTGLFESID